MCSEIVTVNSPSGSTLQCDTWLWDDMPLNSPKRPPYWNSTSGFHFHTSPQSTCYSVPVCEILSKSDHPRQKKMTSCRFSTWRISATLHCRDPIMGSLKSPCATSYRSSIYTITLNCLVFEKIAFFAFWRQTDGQTDGQLRCTKARISRSRYREPRLNNSTINTVLVWHCCKSRASVFTFTSFLLVLDTQLANSPWVCVTFWTTKRHIHTVG